MTAGRDIRIAGTKTIANWKKLKPALVGNADPRLWQQIYKDYFLARLQTRYIAPIETLQAKRPMTGEGFSIVAIQCTLIEFLAATVKGESYRFLRKGEKLAPFEYTVSSKIFTSFLSSEDPFRAQFPPDVAKDFYDSVRCGLLHEACTKNGWYILANSKDGSAIDRKQKVIYRDNLQKLMVDFIEGYGRRLQADSTLQAAFIRKFDKLAE